MPTQGSAGTLATKDKILFTSSAPKLTPRGVIAILSAMATALAAVLVAPTAVLVAPASAAPEFASSVDLGNFSDARIAISADGLPDPDDIGATALSLALVEQAGAANRLVHFHVNSWFHTKVRTQEAEVTASLFDRANALGISNSILFDLAAEARVDGTNNDAIKHLTAQMNKSSASNPLIIVGAGPMEAIYQAASRATSSRLAHVAVVTHSTYNDTNSGPDGSYHDRKAVERLGVAFIEVPDQNANLNTSGSTKGGFSAWKWLKSGDGHEQWVYSRIAASGKPDVSDAGMTYFVLTGNSKPSIADLQELFDGSTQHNTTTTTKPATTTPKDPQVGSRPRLVVVNTKYNKDMRTLEDGALFSRSADRTVRFELDDKRLDSVVWVIDGKLAYIDKTAPFTFAGETGSNINRWQLAPGEHRIYAIVHAAPHDGLAIINKRIRIS